jgi:exopolysaccharide production protein ExoY
MAADAERVRRHVTRGKDDGSVSSPLRVQGEIEQRRTSPVHITDPGAKRLSSDLTGAAPPLRSRLRRRRWRFAKRSLDVLGAIPLAIVATPFIVGAAAAVAITDRGWPFFCQPRVGRDGAVIRVWKIRTMCRDAETRLYDDPVLLRRYVEQGHKLHAHEDPRILGFGRFLRKFSIDELPQVYLVLRGQMSLVGPRPVPEHEVSHLYARAEDLASYTAVKPGLTGAWQVAGRNHVVGSGRAKLDREYVEGWTFTGDLRILARTLPAVLSAHGAH